MPSLGDYLITFTKCLQTCYVPNSGQNAIIILIHKKGPLCFQAHCCCGGASGPEIVARCCDGDLLASFTILDFSLWSNQLHLAFFFSWASFLLALSDLTYFFPIILFFSLSMRTVLRGCEANYEFSYDWPEGVKGTLYPSSFIGLRGLSGSVVQCSVRDQKVAVQSWLMAVSWWEG